jgi:hypothetical protein
LEANRLVQMASNYLSSNQVNEVEVMQIDVADWRAGIFNYLKELARRGGASKQIRYKALRYMLIRDDIYYHTVKGLLLKYLGPH